MAEMAKEKEEGGAGDEKDTEADELKEDEDGAVDDEQEEDARMDEDEDMPEQVCDDGDVIA